MGIILAVNVFKLSKKVKVDGPFRSDREDNLPIQGFSRG